MADNQSRQSNLCQWGSFLFIVICIYLFTFAVPDPIVELTPQQPVATPDGQCPSSYTDSELEKTCLYYDEQYNPVLGMQIFNMNSTNQFLVVQFNYTKVDETVKKLKQRVKFEYEIYQIDEDQTIVDTLYSLEQHEFDIYCDDSDDDYMKNQCQSRWVLYIPEITFEHVMFRFKFLNSLEFSKKVTLSAPSFIYMNTAYTNFLFGVKYTFMVVSLFACILFFFRLRKLPQVHWVIEQKFVLGLSCLLILFNDPFYALTILDPNMASAFFSVLFMVNFLVTLFIFWIVALKRVAEDNAKKNTKTFNKKVIAFGLSMWLFLLLTYVGFSYEYQQHPGTEFYEEFSVEYEIFKVLGIILLSIFFIYLIINYYYIFRDYKNKLWRHRLFSVFSLYFIFCIAIFMYTGTPHVYSSYGERILLFICIMNMYIFYMQFMYSPSNEGLLEAKQTQDLEFPQQQNQIYEMLDESIQIQNINFQQQDNDSEETAQPQNNIQNQNQNNQHVQNQPQAQQIQQFRLGEEDDEEQDEQKMDKIYNN